MPKDDRAKLKVIGRQKRKNPSLRIFKNFCHYTFAIHTGKPTIPKSQEILLLPTDKGQVNFRTFATPFEHSLKFKHHFTIIRGKLESVKIYIFYEKN